MLIGAVWFPIKNAYYRALDPLRAMERRGHRVIPPTDAEGTAEFRRLVGCDVVHVYRRADEATRQVLAQLTRVGTPITYDNDDDYTAISKDSPSYETAGGLEGQRRFADSVQVARLARCFTTTNEFLAEKYRAAGVERVEVIGNCLDPEARRQRRPHDGIVIGWIAAGEHYADIKHINIAQALERLVASHPNVRVECVGVDLGLPERYRHDIDVDFRELPARIAGFDIGIAPLADIPMNWARSDIKLKEYAGSGVPWLASPIGPYLGLGEEHGGRLVPDDGWLEALERLVLDHGEREQLGRNAVQWARHHMIDSVAHRWEQVFAEAATSSQRVGSPSRPTVRIRVGQRAPGVTPPGSK